MTFSESTHWLIVGPIAFNFCVLAGLWASIGTHISIWPFHIDIHLGWWFFSITTKERANEIMSYEEAYREEA